MILFLTFCTVFCKLAVDIAHKCYCLSSLLQSFEGYFVNTGNLFLTSHAKDTLNLLKIENLSAKNSWKPKRKSTFFHFGNFENDTFQSFACHFQIIKATKMGLQPSFSSFKQVRFVFLIFVLAVLEVKLSLVEGVSKLFS